MKGKILFIQETRYIRKNNNICVRDSKEQQQQEILTYKSDRHDSEGICVHKGSLYETKYPCCVMTFSSRESRVVHTTTYVTHNTHNLYPRRNMNMQWIFHHHSEFLYFCQINMPALWNLPIEIPNQISHKIFQMEQS